MSMFQTAILGHEIELKLKLTPADLAKLKRSKVLADNRLTKPKTATLASIYWDTPDLALAAQGTTIRVRAEGRKRIQTVKTAGTRSAALHSRREWEWPILSDHPNIHLLASTGLKAFQDQDFLSRIIPVYTTEFHRTLIRLGSQDWEIEVALDLGKVGAGSLDEAICEVELELIRGSASDLVDLAHRIVQTVPARLLTIPKSERGHHLITGWTPTPAKALPGEISAHMTVGQAFTSIGRNCINQMIANEHCLLINGDPESIHQMRVALRRLRSAIRLFRDLLSGPQNEGIRAELRWLQGSLGPARDAHVFLEEIVAPVVAAHPEMAPLLALRAHWSHESATHVQHAIQAVAGQRFTLLVLDMIGWIEAGKWQDDETVSAVRDLSISDFARKILDKQDRRLRRAATEDPTSLPMPELHNLRILCKQLRYTSEFFAGLFSKRASRLHLSALGELQEILGDVHDISVAADRLSQLTAAQEATTPGLGDSGKAWATGLVAGWHTGRLPALLAQVDGAWERYRKADRYWKG